MGFVIGGVLAVLLIGFLLARPWLIRKGWIFPPGERGSGSRAVMEVAKIFEPEIEHVLEAEQAIGHEAEESGEPDGDDDQSTATPP